MIKFQNVLLLLKLPLEENLLCYIYYLPTKQDDNWIHENNSVSPKTQITKIQVCKTMFLNSWDQTRPGIFCFEKAFIASHCSQRQKKVSIDILRKILKRRLCLWNRIMFENVRIKYT